MHEQSKKFTLFVKNILNTFFINKFVLDINGNNQSLFQNCKYNHSCSKNLRFNDNIFDIIISTECFYYKESFEKIFKMLKSNGLLVFIFSYTEKQNNVKTDFNIKEKFSYYDFYYNKETKDLYFIGIKKSHLNLISYYNDILPKYKNKYCKLI
jgi:SAM-dependent methyltransferase